MDHRMLRIKMQSGDEHIFKTNDDKELLEAYFKLTEKSRIDGVVSRTLSKNHEVSS